jgi:hypothetical protein
LNIALEKSDKTPAPKPSPVPNSKPENNNCANAPVDARVVLNKNCTSGVVLPSADLQVHVNGGLPGPYSCSVLSAVEQMDQPYYVMSVNIFSNDNSSSNQIIERYRSAGISLSQIHLEGTLRGGFKADLPVSSGDKIEVIGLEQDGGVMFAAAGSAQIVLSARTYCKLTNGEQKELSAEDIERIVHFTATMTGDIYLDGRATSREFVQSF